MAYVFRRPWQRVQPSKRYVAPNDVASAANTIANFVSAGSTVDGQTASTASIIGAFTSLSSTIDGQIAAAANVIAAFVSAGAAVDPRKGSATNLVDPFISSAGAAAYQQNFVPGTVVGATNPCLPATIPSYLYQQYADDDNLRAFVDAFNTLAQEYVSWFNAVMLPVYSNAVVAGDLLDWVARGLYGVERPILSVGNDLIAGAYNSAALNATVPYDGRKVLKTAIYSPVDDDTFKRILTWKLYKGDGKNIDVRWLKRRIYRFLYGSNGTDVNCGDTSQISVAFSDASEVTLTVIDETTVSSSATPLYNSFRFNTVGFDRSSNATRTTQSLATYTHGNRVTITLTGSPPNAAIFKEALEQGVLDTPFQFNFVVNVTPFVGPYDLIADDGTALISETGETLTT